MRASETIRASTDALPAADRFPFWADVVAQTFVPLECDSPSRQNFFGNLRHRRVARVGITEVSASAQKVRRTRTKIAQAPSDDLIVVFHVDGKCHVGQKANIATLNAGEGAAVSAHDTYFFEFPEAFRQIVLKIPQDVLGGAVVPGARHAFRLRSGPALLLGRLSAAVLEGPDTNSESEEASTERALLELLRAAILQEAVEDRLRAEASTRYAAACDFIADNLADPALNPDRVAAHVGLSRRSLSRLFATHGQTIERSIWSRRLAAARDALADPHLRDRSITELAFSFGFNDAAHFSRSFSSVYGLSPKRFRGKD